MTIIETTKKSFVYRDDLTRRAFAAYFRVQKDGEFLAQPSRTGSTVETVGEKGYVVLRNTAGVLAVYRVRTDGTLKRLARWPKALEE
jgi:hypothetical protein